jgi:5'/3'-nucleotidase SurE
MRILITNDDGVYSPGIAALAQVASRFGEVRIVAPDVEMSSASGSITASRPLTYKRTQLPDPGLEAYRVDAALLLVHGGTGRIDRRGLGPPGVRPRLVAWRNLKFG